jgi:hypothetical protein
MANIDFAALSGNARLSAVLHRMIELKLADRAELYKAPQFINFGTLNGTGSSALQVPVVGLAGTDLMAAVGDGSSVANTSITSSAATITIARQALRYDITDLASLTDPLASGAGVGIEGLANSMAIAFGMRLTQMITALSSGLSQSVGATTVALSVSTFFDAIYKLQLQSNDGEFAAVLAPQQINHLINSLRSETGPGQYVAATQDQIAAKGQGFRGMLFGVSLYTSSTVPSANAGADRLGMMTATGAIGYATGSPAPIQGAGAIILPAGSQVVVELERDAASGLTKVIGNSFAGVAEIQDLKAVGILSKLAP